MRSIRLLALLLSATLLACAERDATDESETAGDDAHAPTELVEHDCKTLADASNAQLARSEQSDNWFQVYESADGVYSIVEAYQWQETISHLIVGTERALLFDTGIGLLPIRPVVERITDLPVTVLNSHTHYDHIGGNYEFDDVVAIDSDYTRANMQGLDHEAIAIDFTPEAFCGEPPPDSDPQNAITRPWTASSYVKDGDVIDLGGRQITVLHVPGHTPDATALLDEDNGLLFTGDTYYDAQIWLFVPETDLDDYQNSLARLIEIEKEVDYLLGAHNASRVDADKLQPLMFAFLKLRAGDFVGEENEFGQLDVEINGIDFLTSKAVLDGRNIDAKGGGSGLETQP